MIDESSKGTLVISDFLHDRQGLSSKNTWLGYGNYSCFFAHSVLIKLALPQAALLSLHFSLEITVVLHLHEGPD